MDARIKTILQHGIMAPSGDNCQPWKFKVDGLRVELFNAAERDHSLYNLKQRASLIAHGTLLENIRISALEVGLGSSVKLFPNADNIQHVATVEFSERVKEDASPLFAAIAQRHTNREKYQPVKISDKQIEQWQKLPEQAGEKIWVAHQCQQIAQLAGLLSLNDRLVFETPALHRFLFEQIRWNDADALKTGDGLDIKTLGLNAMDKMAFKFLQHWGLVSALNKVGFSRIIQLKAGQLIKSASAIVVVTIPRAESIDYVQGGQLWQRLLLQLASEGLTAQPIAGLACLMQAAHEGLLEGYVTPAQQQLLLNTRTALLQMAGVNENATILTMFRVGKGGQVVTALRKPLRDLIVT